MSYQRALDDHVDLLRERHRVRRARSLGEIGEHPNTVGLRLSGRLVGRMEPEIGVLQRLESATITSPTFPEYPG